MFVSSIRRNGFTFFSFALVKPLLLSPFFTLAGNAQIDEGLFRVISLDSLISPEYTNNRQIGEMRVIHFRCFALSNGLVTLARSVTATWV